MEDINIYELMFEVVEEENFELRKRIEEMEAHNKIMAGYCVHLEKLNKELISDYNSLLDIKTRKN